MKLVELETYLSDYLQTKEFEDYAPNGLQVEGRPEIEKLAVGVTSSLEVIERARDWGADALLVHHGLFWKGQSATITGYRKRRIEQLVKNDISLFAYHLPLDAHPEVGNNARIARRLGLVELEEFAFMKGKPLGFRGRLPRPWSIDEMKRTIHDQFTGDCMVFDFGPLEVHTVGVCSGGAPEFISEAIESGLDLYLTGETAEWAFHLAREEGIHFVAGGHHRTEVFGVQALAEHLKSRFGLDTEFFDEPNPV